MVNNKENNNGSRRDRLYIIRDMLNAGRAGVKKTALMYNCNLSSKQFQDHTSTLLRSKLFETVQNDEKVYRTTDKGLKFLKLFSLVNQLLMGNDPVPNGSFSAYVKSSAGPYVNGVPLSNLNGKNGLYLRI